MKIDSTQMTTDAMDFTKEVTTRWTSRISGSEACLACGDFLHDQFDSFSDYTAKEEFKSHPGSFLGFMKICVVFYFLAVFALIINQIEIATVLSLIPIIITVTHFFYYKEVIDFMYPEKTGRNITGTIEPSSDVKRQVIISAHHDSAHIFNFLEHDPDHFIKKTQLANAAIFGLAFACVMMSVINFTGFPTHYLRIVAMSVFILLSYNVYQLWHFYDEEGTPGAGDNMICTAIAMQVGKYFQQEKNTGTGLKHTRVIVASWDAEEAGLRGARAYVKKHHGALKTIKTYNFNLECMYDHTEMGFLLSDLNSFVPLSSGMVNECVESANALGYRMKKTLFPLMAGGTDAAEFAKAGVEATTLAAMSWTKRSDGVAYHTTRDTIDAVDPIAVSRSIETAIHYILKKDGKVN